MIDLDKIINMHEESAKMRTELSNLYTEKKKNSKLSADPEASKEQGRAIRDRIRQIEANLNQIQSQFISEAAKIPNFGKCSPTRKTSSIRPQETQKLRNIVSYLFHLSKYIRMFPKTNRKCSDSLEKSQNLISHSNLILNLENTSICSNSKRHRKQLVRHKPLITFKFEPLFNLKIFFLFFLVIFGDFF